jgi:hypothetical protein
MLVEHGQIEIMPTRQKEGDCCHESCRVPIDLNF